MGMGITSFRPLLSISAMHSTISIGILGWPAGAKLSNNIWEENKHHEIRWANTVIMIRSSNSTCWVEPPGMELFEQLMMTPFWHSRWVTIRQFLHFTAILPKRILFPQAEQFSGRITWRVRRSSMYNGCVCKVLVLFHTRDRFYRGSNHHRNVCCSTNWVVGLHTLLVLWSWRSTPVVKLGNC